MAQDFRSHRNQRLEDFLPLWVLLGGLRKSFFDHWELALPAPVLVGLPELVDHILGVALLAASSHIFVGLF